MTDAISDRENVVIYPDDRKRLRNILTTAAVGGAFMTAYLFVLLRFSLYMLHLIPVPIPPFVDFEFTAFPWFSFAVSVVTASIMAIAVQRKHLPIVTISQEGVTVCVALEQMELIHWDEIAEIRTYKFIYWYVGIFPRDAENFYRHLERQGSWLFRLSYWMVRQGRPITAPIYRRFGVTIAPINIPQEYLPMSADELAERIRACRQDQPA